MTVVKRAVIAVWIAVVFASAIARAQAPAPEPTAPEPTAPEPTAPAPTAPAPTPPEPVQPPPAAPTPKLPSEGVVIKGQRGWIVDGHVGAPILENRSFKFVANGMLGYRWNKLELIAYGNLNQYSSASDNVLNNTTRAGWRVNGAYVTGLPGDRFRWLFVMDLMQALYLTRYVELSTTSASDLLAFNLNIKNEDSHMLRQSTLVG